MALPDGRMSAWGLARKRRLESTNPVVAPARRVRRRTRRVKMPKFPWFFADQPQRKFAKLKYVEHYTTNGPAANAIVTKEYRANDLYDPRYAIGGHQPYGFDQIIAQYYHFTVLKSVCKVTIEGAQQYVDVLAILQCYNAAGIPAAMYAAAAAGQGNDTLRELPMTSKDIIITIGEYKEQTRMQFLTADMTKIFGKTAWNLIGDSRFQGNDGASPAEDCFFGITLYSPTYSDQSAKAFNVKVEIDYYACFTEPRWFIPS